jgi:hypothetical protein
MATVEQTFLPGGAPDTSFTVNNTLELVSETSIPFGYSQETGGKMSDPARASSFEGFDNPVGINAHGLALAEIDNQVIILRRANVSEISEGVLRAVAQPDGRTLQGRGVAEVPPVVRRLVFWQTPTVRLLPEFDFP